MPSIDLNCDMGEGMGMDDIIMPLISSANIACGAHAGDESTMKATVDLALKFNVKIGAHPSFPDKAHFGRSEMKFTPEAIFDLVSDQIFKLSIVARGQGGSLNHVKPHGALYNIAARDFETAEAIAKAVYAFDPQLLLFGLAGSQLIKQGNECGLVTVNEVFADRTYQDDGSLTPRSLPGSMITDAVLSVKQILQILERNEVISLNGLTVSIMAETICLHGDAPDAPEFARMIRAAIIQLGISIEAPPRKR
jgi:5-oxoprolinase (ATP-hydrolysing) subunit A